MPYLINRTSGSKITTVQDGTVDITSLDITLVGKNYTGYGEAFNENFVKMLENFAGASRPKKPLTGQLWYDSSNKSLKLYTGFGNSPWKSIGLLESSSSKPVGVNSGDLWFNSSEGRLYAYSGVGTNWILVGPLSTRIGESGALEYKALKESVGDAIVLKMVVNGQQPAIISPETFNVNAADAIFSSDTGAYRVIKKGITLGDMLDDANGVSYTPVSGGNIVWGTTASALGLVKSDGTYYPADSFLLEARLANLSSSIRVGVDDGILIGDQGVMKLHVTDGNTGNVSILDQSAGRVAFEVNIGSVNSNVITITTASTSEPEYAILPNSTATIWMGTDSQRFSFGYFNTLTASTFLSNTISADTISDSGKRVITSITHTGGPGISISAETTSGPAAAVTINNTGVLSAIGTANQVNVSTATGNVTFSLPQSINTTAEVTFAKVISSTVTSTEVYDSSARVITTATIGGYLSSSVYGTANQITVTPGLGFVTLSLPQNIAASSNVQFANIQGNDITSSKILVGTATGGTAGDVRASGDVVAFATSDIKFKENVRDIPNPVSKAIAIGGKLFDWTDEYLEKRGGADGLYLRKEDVGVIAQDVQRELPEAVRTREDGTLAVDYPKLCALAFAAIADLQKQIDELKANK